MKDNTAKLYGPKSMAHYSCRPRTMENQRMKLQVHWICADVNARGALKFLSNIYLITHQAHSVTLRCCGC